MGEKTALVIDDDPLAAGIVALSREDKERLPAQGVQAVVEQGNLDREEYRHGQEGDRLIESRENTK